MARWGVGVRYVTAVAVMVAGASAGSAIGSVAPAVHAATGVPVDDKKATKKKVNYQEKKLVLNRSHHSTEVNNVSESASASAGPRPANASQPRATVEDMPDVWWPW